MAAMLAGARLWELRPRVAVAAVFAASIIGVLIIDAPAQTPISMGEIERTIEDCRAGSGRTCMCPTHEVDSIPCSIELPNNSCGRYPKWQNPDADPTSWNACMDDCKAKNNKIRDYNNVVENCRIKGAQSQPHSGPVPPSDSSLHSELTRAKEEAKKRAENSEAVDAKAKAQLPETRRRFDEGYAAEKAAAEAKERQRQLDAARARRDAELARQFHCFGSSEVCTNNCCARYYQLFGYECNQGRCSSQCDSMSGGGFCYRERP